MKVRGAPAGPPQTVEVVMGEQFWEDVEAVLAYAWEAERRDFLQAHLPESGSPHLSREQLDRLLEGGEGEVGLLDRACRPGEGHVFAAMWRLGNAARAAAAGGRPARLTARERGLLSELLALMRGVARDVRRDAPI